MRFVKHQTKIRKIKKSKDRCGLKVFRRRDHDNALKTKNIHIDEKPIQIPVITIRWNPNSLKIAELDKGLIYFVF